MLVDLVYLPLTLPYQLPLFLLVTLEVLFGVFEFFLPAQELSLQKLHFLALLISFVVEIVQLLEKSLLLANEVIPFSCDVAQLLNDSSLLFIIPLVLILEIVELLYELFMLSDDLLSPKIDLLAGRCFLSYPQTQLAYFLHVCVLLLVVLLLHKFAGLLVFRYFILELSYEELFLLDYLFHS